MAFDRLGEIVVHHAQVHLVLGHQRAPAQLAQLFAQGLGRTEKLYALFDLTRFDGNTGQALGGVSEAGFQKFATFGNT